MHMQNGLGRTGYVLLAFVLFATGGLGLGATYFAYVDGALRFFQLGLLLVAIGLAGLFGFAAWAPWLGGAPRAKVAPKAAPAAPAASAPAPATSRPGSTGHAGGVEFEFQDAQPAAKAAPVDMVLPSAFRDERPPGGDPAAWPARRGKSDWTAAMERRACVEQMTEESPVRREMQERYTRTTPTVRGILQEPPIHVADRAPAGVEPGFAAPGMSVGQCGRCRTVVMAPEARPLRLKCPECAKVTLLN